MKARQECTQNVLGTEIAIKNPKSHVQMLSVQVDSLVAVDRGFNSAAKAFTTGLNLGSLALHSVNESEGKSLRKPLVLTHHDPRLLETHLGHINLHRRWTRSDAEPLRWAVRRRG